MADLDPQVEQEVLRQFQARLDSARRHQEEIVERKRRAHLVTRGESNPKYGYVNDPNDASDWRHYQFPKIAFQKKQQYVAELCESLPEFDARPRPGQYQYIDYAEAANDVVAYYLDAMEFPKLFRKTADTVVEYGDQVVMTTWRHEVAKRRVIEEYEEFEDEVDEETGDIIEAISLHEREVIKDEVIYSGPWIERIAYEDSLPDPRAKEDGQCKWWIRRWRATLAELKAMGDLYFNLDKLAPTGGDDLRDQPREGETQEAYEARRQGVHTLYDMWTPYGVTVVANESTVIRHDQDPLDPLYPFGIPLSTIKLIDDDDNLGGISLMLQIESDQEAYWKFWNGLLDAAEWAVNPPFVRDTEADVNAAKVKLYPGAALEARNGKQTIEVMRDIANLNYAGAQSILGYCMAHMDGVTGINDAVMGLSNSSNATEADLNMNAARRRILLGVDVMDDDWSKVMTRVLQLVQKFGSERIIGKLVEDGRIIDRDPSEIQGQFKVDVRKTSRRVMREQMLNRSTTALNSLIPLVEPGTVQVAEAVTGVIHEMLRSQDLDQFVPSVTGRSSADVAREQNQLAAEAQAQQGEIAMNQQLAQQSMMPEPPVA